MGVKTMNKFKIGLFTIVNVITFLLFILAGCSFENVNSPRDDALLSISKEANALPIPPLLEDMKPSGDEAEFYLKAQKSTKAFLNGIETETFGYNGDFLGPVIKVKKGEKAKVHIENNLGDEETTVHWHGLEIPGDVDGGPHQVIQPNEVITSSFTISQPAATLWYHPHPLHKTGEQVYKGLAGLFYIEDDESDNLNIPKTYGVNDFPIVIQDRNLMRDGQLSYDLNMMSFMHGMQGDTPLVNGAFEPYLEVPKGKVRLRILNGSNARVFQLKLSRTHDFWQIASDGGFLEKPLNMNSVVLAPAERAEIIVDFSSFKEGEKVKLFDQDIALMNFVIGSESKEISEIPDKLTTIEKINPAEATATRTFTLQGMGKTVNINGKQMDMDRIDEEVQLNTTEVWEVINPAHHRDIMTGMPHPFHVHGVQFQVLERNGREPPENERGWKDTVLLMPGEKVKIIATFKEA